MIHNAAALVALLLSLSAYAGDITFRNTCVEAAAYEGANLVVTLKACDGPAPSDGSNLDIESSKAANSGDKYFAPFLIDRTFARMDFTDTEVAGGDFVNGLQVIQSMDNSASTGGRQALSAILIQNKPTAEDNTNRNYVGAFGYAYTGSGDGGTSKADPRGGYFGMNPVVTVAGGEYILNASGTEVDVQVYKGSGNRVWYVSGVQVAATVHDERGYGIDAAYTVGAGGSVGWKHGILFGNMNGSASFAHDSVVFASYSPENVDSVFDVRNFRANSILQGNNITITDGAILLPGMKSISGTRYVCVGTDGKLVSQATACKGT